MWTSTARTDHDRFADDKASGDVVARGLGGDIHSTSVSGEVELDLNGDAPACAVDNGVTARAELTADARVGSRP